MAGVEPASEVHEPLALQAYSFFEFNEPGIQTTGAVSLFAVKSHRYCRKSHTCQSI